MKRLEGQQPKKLQEAQEPRTVLFKRLREITRKAVRSVRLNMGLLDLHLFSGRLMCEPEPVRRIEENLDRGTRQTPEPIQPTTAQLLTGETGVAFGVIDEKRGEPNAMFGITSLDNGTFESGLRALSTNEANAYAPSWSPDGSKITFIYDEGGRTKIYAINVDGGELVEVGGMDLHGSMGIRPISIIEMGRNDLLVLNPLGESELVNPSGLWDREGPEEQSRNNWGAPKIIVLDITTEEGKTRVRLEEGQKIVVAGVLNVDFVLEAGGTRSQEQKIELGEVEWKLIGILPPPPEKHANAVSILNAYVQDRRAGKDSETRTDEIVDAIFSIDNRYPGVGELLSQVIKYADTSAVAVAARMVSEGTI